MGILNNLFTNDDTFKDIDNKIDSLINNIRIEEKRFTTEENTGKLIDSFINSVDNNSDINKLYQSMSVPTERLLRYSLYEEMYKTVPIIKKIIKTYISNIIPKNPADGTCLIYKDVIEQPEDAGENKNKAKDYIKDFVNYFNIIDKYKNIILPKRLLYGDIFVEVVDVSNDMKNVDLNKQHQVVTENSLSQFNNLLNINGWEKRTDHFIEKLTDILVDFEIVSELEGNKSFDYIDSVEKTFDNISKSFKTHDVINDENKDDKIIKKYKHKFENILLKIHNPSSVVILTTKYGSKIGYLEILKTDSSGQSYTQTLTNIISKVTNVSGKKTESNQEAMINRMIFFLVKKIVSSVGQNNPELSSQDANDLIRNLNPDVYLFIKKLFIEQGLYTGNIQQKSLKVRFIPPTKMVQFKTTSLDYEPYGESVIENVILPCKLYTLSQLSNTVSKLSRASILRKWTVEAGSSRTQSQRVQQLRRELNNTKTTLESFSSIKNVPKLLTDFKDMITVSQNGQKAFDVEMQSFGDTSINVADLEDARKEIISLTGIPAPYLGYMDQVELKEQLVHTSISFATEIIDMQQQDILSLNKLIQVVSYINGLDFDPTKYISLTLIPPVILVLQLIETAISSLGNISSVFMNMSVEIDPYYLLRQFVPHMDWDMFLKSTKDKKIKDEVSGALAGAGGAQPSSDDGSGEPM